MNKLAEGEAFMAIGAFSVSDDGKLLAYSTDTTGFRQYTPACKRSAQRRVARGARGAGGFH